MWVGGQALGEVGVVVAVFANVGVANQQFFSLAFKNSIKSRFTVSDFKKSMASMVISVLKCLPIPENASSQPLVSFR